MPKHRPMLLPLLSITTSWISFWAGHWWESTLSSGWELQSREGKTEQWWFLEINQRPSSRWSKIVYCLQTWNGNIRNLIPLWPSVRASKKHNSRPSLKERWTYMLGSCLLYILCCQYIISESHHKHHSTSKDFSFFKQFFPFS